MSVFRYFLNYFRLEIKNGEGSGNSEDYSNQAKSKFVFIIKIICLILTIKYK